MLDLSLPMPPFTVARLKLLTLDSQKFSEQLNKTSIVYMVISWMKHPDI